MAFTVDELRAHAIERGLEVYEVPDGIGVRFRDGFDVYWLLPEERWYFLNGKSAPTTLDEFDRLNERRERVVDAIRRYLARQKIAVYLARNGDWSTMSGAVSSSLSVGVPLTKILMEEKCLVASVRRIFECNCIRQPSDRRIGRHLEEFEKPLAEHRWPDEELSCVPETPLTALHWMGLCNAMTKESSFTSAEAFVSAAQPKGWIGRALLQLAQRLPDTKAALECTDGSLCIDFWDEYASFSVAPQSRELRDLVKQMGPEKAGDHLADAYERLDAARRRVLNAVFGVLGGHGFYIDSSDGEHVGREVREFTLNLGESLTTTIRESGEEFAVRTLLGGHMEFADEAVAWLHDPRGDVTLPERTLRPPEVPALKLPDLAEEQIALLDEWSKELLREFLTTDEALAAYSDPLRWDVSIDSWASATQWQQLAEEYVGRKYPRADAETILIDFSHEERESRFAEQLRESGLHHEAGDQEIEMAWCLRNEMPELAAGWFDTDEYQDISFAEERAQLGDPIAICHIIGGLEEDTDQAVPNELASIPPDAVARLVGSGQLTKWREAASQWAGEAWQWDYGGEDKVLAVAANMGWPEVCDHLVRNPFLLPGLLQGGEDGPGIRFADRLLLAWSRLNPSTFLLKLVGYVLSMDPLMLTSLHSRRIMRSVSLDGERSKEAREMARGAWNGHLGVALAISWHRCRKGL